MSTPAKKGLPSRAERPDLYDGFDGLRHAPKRENPIGVPSRLQALMAERQANAEPEKTTRKYGLRPIGKTAKGKTIKALIRKKHTKAAPKQESHPTKKAAAVG